MPHQGRSPVDLGPRLRGDDESLQPSYVKFNSAVTQLKDRIVQEIRSGKRWRG